METLPTSKRISVRSLLVFAVTLLLGPGASTCFAVALFDSSTDTIKVAGNTVLTTAATIEARLFFSDTYAASGTVFNEWANGAEDKLLRITLGDPASIVGSFYGAGGVTATVTIALNRWHHIAYVYDGSEHRLYLDGVQVASRVISGTIRNSSGLPFIGAIFRDGHVGSSFVGYIDFLRVSNIARYSGSTVAVPSPDVGTDANTQLLYRFDEAPGSTTITDYSGNGHTGTLGTGFTGATLPDFVPNPSNNADLASLVPSVGTMAPVFAPATTSYTANLPDTTTTMTVTPTASDSAASIQVRINGGSYSGVASGSASAPLPITIGVNTIDVKVTAADTTTTKIYTSRRGRATTFPKTYTRREQQLQ